MLLDVLQQVKRRTRTGPIRKVVTSLGILQIGRRFYNRRILRQGTLDAAVVGHRFRFVDTTEAEIGRIDGLSREEDFYARIGESVRPGDVFYDVGANIGMVSMLVASRGREVDAQVHAFEPEPVNARRLRDNLATNGISTVEVHELGLAAESGTTSLYVAGDAGTGAHSMIADLTGSSRTIDIRVMAMTDFAAEHPAPSCVKIDVEGAEMEVLRGAGNLLAPEKVHDIFIEVHRGILESAGSSEAEVTAFMEQRGFALVWSQERGRQVLQHFRPRGA